MIRKLDIHNKTIGLLDVDSHNFPNLPLMKIKRHYGDIAEMYDENKHYDIVFASKIFTESKIPEEINADKVVLGGSGIDLINKLPYEIEHEYPDYGLYNYKSAIGILTRGCPRKDHGFCITPKKDGCQSVKTADLSEFWSGQRRIQLLDQNLLACKDRIELLTQLAKSGASIDFVGGTDVRFVDDEVISIAKKMKVLEWHFAWDNPREDLYPNLQKAINAGIIQKERHVYVLTNYWSTLEEDLYRVYKLRELKYLPYICIYDKQKYVDKNGHWLKGVENKYTVEQLRHFKTLQHMQRWCNSPKHFIRIVPKFEDYDRYKNWVKNGMRVPDGRLKEVDNAK